MSLCVGRKKKMKLTMAGHRPSDETPLISNINVNKSAGLALSRLFDEAGGVQEARLIAVWCKSLNF